MKLVKSLILGSTAGVLAVAGAQAADLPSRKAAPVEYVRICDAFGTGYFYIPGTDTCLRVGGRLRAEYRWQNEENQYNAPFLPGFTGGVPNTLFYSAGGVPINTAPVGAVLPVQPAVPVVFSGAYLRLPSKFIDQSGFRSLGRIEVDARTQTAWGTLRTFVRYEIQYNQGRYQGVNGGVNGSNTTDYGENVYMDKGFIQFAGITAGKAQSMFDFYADNYGYEDLRGSDESINLLAYTATFGGGFSATLSLEDSTQRRAGTLAAAGAPFGYTTVGGVFVPTGVVLPAFVGYTYAGASYNGQTWPDVVGVLRVDQGWGSAQLSAALHNQNSSALFNYSGASIFGAGGFGPAGVVGVNGGGNNGSNNTVGWAIQGGVQFKLPMLAAGDDIWLQAAYAHGALDYQQVGAQEFGRNPNGNGWGGCFAGGFTVGGTGNGCDGESVYYIDSNGFVHHVIPNSWTVVAAINHYFTPTFATSLRASYLNVSYGNGARYPWSGPILGAAGAVISTTTPGQVGVATNWSEWRVGINPEWYPVKNLTFGFELMYIHVNQKAPLVSGLNGTVFAYGGGLVGNPAGTLGVYPWKSNINGWEARLRVQRDF
jgi:hypothetical protein